MIKSLIQGWRPALVFILLIIVWELSVINFHIEEWLLPKPSQVFSLMWSDFSNYSVHLESTVQLILAGFTVGTVVGVIAALLLHLVPFFKQSMYPLLILSQNIPIIVLAPLLVIWFGYGMLPKIIIITLVCFFPIAISLLDGFRQTNRDLLHYMRMAGASRSQLFWKLEWPSALPSLFSGLKISATYSVMGAVISEWLGASEGIGVYMTLASSSFRTTRVFVAIMIVVFLSLLFFLIIVWIEKIVIRWRDQEKGSSNEAPGN